MASDNLNEIGKFMKKTREDADYALNRYLQKRARIERTRDVFSSALSFVMYFRTDEDEHVNMDINFNKPPPGGIGAYSTGSCDLYNLTTEDNIVTTINPYEAGTVIVFVNGNEYPTSKWSEYDVGAHQVFVQGAVLPTNVLVVCYERA